MVKPTIAIVLVAGVVLFGYFFARNRADLSGTDRAKQAAIDVGDAVRDTGVAGLIRGRLVTKFGFEATRFVHAYYDAGRVVLYGLVPAEVAPQDLADEAAQVPGVNQVELLVQPRPDYITPLKAIAGSTPAAQGELTPASPEEVPEP